LAKRSLSKSFLSNESVTQIEIIEGWKLGEFNSLMHRETSFSSLALKREHFNRCEKIYMLSLMIYYTQPSWNQLLLP
jgi:hypothetical protein